MLGTTFPAAFSLLSEMRPYSPVNSVTRRRINLYVAHSPHSHGRKWVLQPIKIMGHLEPAYGITITFRLLGFAAAQYRIHGSGGTTTAIHLCFRRIPSI